MTTITPYFFNQDFIQRLRAPKGLMFSIKGITSQARSATADNSIMVYDKDLADSLISATFIDGLIYQLDLNTSVAHQQIYHDFECKYITIGMRNTTTIDGFIFIEYDLVKASRLDLIWAWWRKGR